MYWCPSVEPRSPSTTKAYLQEGWNAALGSSDLLMAASSGETGEMYPYATPSGCSPTRQLTSSYSLLVLTSIVLLESTTIASCLPCPLLHSQVQPARAQHLSCLLWQLSICTANQCSQPASLAGSLSFPLLGWISATLVIVPWGCAFMDICQGNTAGFGIFFDNSGFPAPVPCLLSCWSRFLLGITRSK